MMTAHDVNVIDFAFGGLALACMAVLFFLVRWLPARVECPDEFEVEGAPC